MRVFHTRVSWWFLTVVWVTASLLKSPGLFSVFWSILITLSLGWSPLVLLFPSPPVPLSILWWLYRAQQLRFLSQSPCSIVFSSSLRRSRYLSLFWLSFNCTQWSAGTANPLFGRLSFFIIYYILFIFIYLFILFYLFIFFFFFFFDDHYVMSSGWD